MNSTEKLIELLRNKNATFCTAESCTGGNISATLTRIPGCSDVFKGAAVTYCNEAKHNLLGVSLQTLEKYTAVSLETVTEMAEGALKLFNTDFAASVSGCAGPGGGTDEIPIGTICFGFAAKGGKTIAQKLHFSGNRIDNINAATAYVIDTMIDIISKA